MFSQDVNPETTFGAGNMRCPPTGGARSGRLGEANPKSHVDACVDRLNEGLWSPGVANTTPYLTGSVFTVAKVKRRKSEAVTCTLNSTGALWARKASLLP